MHLLFNTKWNSRNLNFVYCEIHCFGKWRRFVFGRSFSFYKDPVNVCLWFLWIYHETTHGCSLLSSPSWYEMFTYQNRFSLCRSFLRFLSQFRHLRFAEHEHFERASTAFCVLSKWNSFIILTIFAALLSWIVNEKFFSFCILRPNTIDNLFDYCCALCTVLSIFLQPTICNIDIHYLLLCDYEPNSTMYAPESPSCVQ